nr:hypothetical protein [Candidatus Wukongarchaeota archaeon]
PPTSSDLTGPHRKNQRCKKYAQSRKRLDQKGTSFSGVRPEKCPHPGRKSILPEDSSNTQRSDGAEPRLQ